MAKKSYDSDFCGSLPLHHINQIQPYGYLMVLDSGSLEIIQVSENVQDLLGIPVDEIVNSSFTDYVIADQPGALKDKFNTGVKDKVPLSLTLGYKGNNHKMLALIHLKSNYLLIELEKVSADGERYFTEVFQGIRYSIAAIEHAGTIEEACSTAIKELKKVSGFDGVMMYRFDNDWNGTVIAEEKNEGMETFLGNTFPASDVPKQARELYLKNPYRLIPNREFTPVRLYPVINPVTHTFTDLSDCNLRSVAAVHLEYLKNMGVAASMSVRVIKDGELWGLIACHHNTPKYLSYEICSVIELLSSVISNRISYLYNKHEFDAAASLQTKRAEIIEQVYAENDLAKGMISNKAVNLMGIFNATGAALIENGTVQSAGVVPGDEDLENLVLWLQGKQVNKIYESNNLTALYDDAAKYADIASGLLVIPVDGDKGNYICCFRPELLQTINWGGDPNQAINFDKDGKGYHPRTSFKLWQQTVQQTSAPWTDQEIATAETLRSFAFEFKTKQIFG